MVDKMGALVLDDIKQQGGMTFVDLEHFFEKHNFSYRGDMWLSQEAYGKNVWTWSGWNEQASDVIAYLLENGCVCTYVPPFEYLIGGKALTLEIAKNPFRDYKEDRWFPVVYMYKPEYYEDKK